MADDCLFEPIPIRYDGRDALRHELELHSLGVSAMGLARVLSATGQFVLTNRYVRHMDTMDVRVFVAPPSAGSLEIVAKLREVAQGQLFKGAGAAIGKLLAYLMAKFAGRKDAQERFEEFARFALEQQRGLSEQAMRVQLETVERMVKDLRPAAKQIVTPIGISCSTIRLGRPEWGAPQLDVADKEVIEGGPDTVITDTERHAVLISELDMVTGGCKVSFPDNPEKRYRGCITDPQVYVQNNIYWGAMGAGRPIEVYTKMTLKDGVIQKVFISDIAR